MPCMASAPRKTDGTLDEFMQSNGHDMRAWEADGAKKRCPDCGGVQDPDAADCTVCGWSPGR